MPFLIIRQAINAFLYFNSSSQLQLKLISSTVKF